MGICDTGSLFFEFSLLPPPPKERKTKLCLDGYFQSYKYFNNERVDISRLIGLPDKIQRVKDIMLENVKSDYGDDLIEKGKLLFQCILEWEITNTYNNITTYFQISII